MPFEIISELAQVEIFAVGTAIRELDSCNVFTVKDDGENAKALPLSN